MTQPEAVEKIQHIYDQYTLAYIRQHLACEGLEVSWLDGVNDKQVMHVWGRWITEALGTLGVQDNYATILEQQKKLIDQTEKK